MKLYYSVQVVCTTYKLSFSLLIHIKITCTHLDLLDPKTASPTLHIGKLDIWLHGLP